MSNDTPHGLTAQQKRLLKHFTDRLIKKRGGPVPLSEVAMRVSDVADIAEQEAINVIQTESAFTITHNNGEKCIQAVVITGPEPDPITDHFGPRSNSQSDITNLPGVDADIASILENYYDDVTQLSEADPETVADIVNDELDQRAEPAEFETDTFLTPAERSALHDIGITTNRDLVQADPEAVVTELQDSTLTESKIKRAQATIDEEVVIYDVDDAEQIVQKAFHHKPSGRRIGKQAIERHRERKAATGSAKANITRVHEETATVGEPLADVRDDVTVNDPEAFYVSDFGHTESDPVVTGLPVLEDVGYEHVPRLESDPGAGHEALPVDSDGNPVPPTVPLERDLQMPIDVLVANKLGRNVPVRLVGPHGSGKNYLLKWLCYQTNRGYRSIDVDRDTMPTDLFGPLSPDEDGKIEPKNGEVKQALINGDVCVLNEFPVMQSGAAMALHQLLNENKLVIKSHGEEIKPHEQARIVITMNPPTVEYPDSEPMNAATRDRFRTFWQGYPDSVDDEVRTLDQQINNPRTVVPEDTLERIVTFAHKTRKDEMSNWPTLSTRSLTVVCEHIADGASPAAATKNVIRNAANPSESPTDAFNAINETI